MLAVALLPEFEAEAKERQGRRTDLEHSGKTALKCEGVSKEEFRASMDADAGAIDQIDAAIDKIDEALGITAGQARDKAASVVSVSPRMVSDAKAIQAEDPEL